MVKKPVVLTPHSYVSYFYSDYFLMVLASTNTTILDDITQLADEIKEVATPLISYVSASTEVEVSVVPPTNTECKHQQH